MSFYEMEFSPVVALPKWQVLDRVSKRFLPLIIWLNCSVPKTPQDDCFLDRLDFTSEHDVLHTTQADLVHLSIMWCMDTDRIRKMRIKWVKRNSEFKLKCNIEMWKWLPWKFEGIIFSAKDLALPWYQPKTRTAKFIIQRLIEGDAWY